MLESVSRQPVVPPRIRRSWLNRLASIRALTTDYSDDTDRRSARGATGIRPRREPGVSCFRPGGLPINVRQPRSHARGHVLAAPGALRGPNRGFLLVKSRNRMDYRCLSQRNLNIDSPLRRLLRIFTLVRMRSSSRFPLAPILPGCFSMARISGSHTVVCQAYGR